MKEHLKVGTTTLGSILEFPVGAFSRLRFMDGNGAELVAIGGDMAHLKTSAAPRLELISQNPSKVLTVYVDDRIIDQRLAENRDPLAARWLEGALEDIAESLDGNFTGADDWGLFTLASLSDSEFITDQIINLNS